jgi:hypothetical protein
MNRIVFALILLNYLSTPALALSIALNGNGPGTFALDVYPSQFPIDLVFDLESSSESPVNVLAWQLELCIQPSNYSEGSLLFTDVNTPPNPLYPDQSSPQSIPQVPPGSPAVLLSDADTTDPFDGNPVSHDTPKSIVQLALLGHGAVAGSFQLRMKNYDPNDASGSAWLDAADESGTPIPFDNCSPCSVPGTTLLGTIAITPVAGDYNGDGQVDSADYSIWRSNYGQTVTPPGSGADGNQNGVVDAGDYVVWRALANTPALTSNVRIPEPAGLTTIAILFASICISFRVKRGN